MIYLLSCWLFPGGIFYNVEKHQYLTKEINKFAEVASSISDSCGSKKNGNSQKISENSHPVVASGVEPESALGGYESLSI
jgi:hypothetical protein